MAGDKDRFSDSILRISLRLLINMILIFVLVEGFVGAYHFSYRLFADLPESAASQQESKVTIPEGENAWDVAVTLEKCGIVDSRYLFLARAYLGKYNNRIQSGEYMLSPAMTPEEICKKICGQQSEEDK